MYNSNDLSYGAVNENMVQTIGYEETAGSKKTGIFYAVLGWAFSFIALVFVPILFGALAFSLGLITYYGRNKAHGVAVMVFASISLILGSMLSFFVTGTLFI
jgi:hypothetical protein